MNDLISRQAAIDALHMHLMYRMGIDSNKKRLDEWINNLPPAQPEQNTGKWIEKEICETRRKEEMQTAKCSNCGKYLTTPYIYSFTHYDFCPNCGARMEGDTLK